MSRSSRFVNPAALSKPSGFSHIALGSVREIAFISGQVAYDGRGNIVGIGDLAAQTRQVLQNIATALAAIGATFDDVLKFTFFVRDLSEDAVATIRRVRAEFLPPIDPPASTMVGVAALAKRELLLEVEAYVAVSPDAS